MPVALIRVPLQNSSVVKCLVTVNIRVYRVDKNVEQRITAPAILICT
jgi:hypothetical protein